MKIRNIIFLTAFGMLAVLSMAMVSGPSSSGAPAGHAGAPGEQSCTAAGCHDDNTMNAGTASLSAKIGGVLNYSPKKSYPISIKITDAESVRFGFQITAYSLTENKTLGRFIITDPLRTQLTSNTELFPDREYVTYTFDGTDAVSKGVGEWTLNWRAPSENLGPVTFYVSAVSANDNENDKGDFVYTTSFTINDSK